MILQIRIMFPVFALLFMTGCGTQYAYHQTETEVHEFKNLSLENFIREKIIDGDNTQAAFNVVFEPLSKVISTVSGGPSIQEEVENRKKNFIYKALFDCRYHALTKPKKDLEFYCKSNGGYLEANYINTTNLAGDSRINPLEAYVNVMKSNIKDMDSEIRLIGISIPLHCSKEKLAESYEKIVYEENKKSGMYKAYEPIDKAINEESFGTFSCIKNKETFWSVEIMPLILQHAPSVITDLNAPLYRVYIGIIPLHSQAN